MNIDYYYHELLFQQGTTQFILLASTNQPTSLLDKLIHKQIRYGKVLLYLIDSASLNDYNFFLPTLNVQLINEDKEVVEVEKDVESFSITTTQYKVSRC